MWYVRNKMLQQKVDKRLALYEIDDMLYKN